MAYIYVATSSIDEICASPRRQLLSSQCKIKVLQKKLKKILSIYTNHDTVSTVLLGYTYLIN